MAEVRTEVHCDYLPESLCREFVKRVLKQRICWGEKTDYFRQLCIYWRTAQRIIQEIDISPSDWDDERNRIYLYFKVRHFSVSYAQKVIRILNLWGKFYGKRTNIYYEPVPNPRGEASVRIQESFFLKKPQGHVSSPLTLEQLRRAKRVLFLENYNWLFLSLWFGLRPSELKKLTWTMEEYRGQSLLAVYQHKLVRLPADQRWKFIPILFKEQKLGLEIIKRENYRIPLVKTVQRHIDPKLSLRAGRKGFVTLMWEQGGYPKAITYRWLGHKSIRTTENHYVQGIQQACEFSQSRSKN